MSVKIALGLDSGGDPVRTLAVICRDGKAVAQFEQLYQRYLSWTAQAALLYTPA